MSTLPLPIFGPDLVYIFIFYSLNTDFGSQVYLWRKIYEKKNGWSSSSTFWHRLICIWACDKRSWSKVGHTASKSNSSKLFSVLPLESGMFQAYGYSIHGYSIHHKKNCFDPSVCCMASKLGSGQVWLFVTMDTVNVIIIQRKPICMQF